MTATFVFKTPALGLIPFLQHLPTWTYQSASTTVSPALRLLGSNGLPPTGQTARHSNKLRWCAHLSCERFVIAPQLENVLPPVRFLPFHQIDNPRHVFDRFLLLCVAGVSSRRPSPLNKTAFYCSNNFVFAKFWRGPDERRECDERRTCSSSSPCWCAPRHALLAATLSQKWQRGVEVVNSWTNFAHLSPITRGQAVLGR